MKKSTFPPECCGACGWCHATDKEMGMCAALPPQVAADEDGILSARPFVEFNEPACIYFKPRIHA